MVMAISRALDAVNAIDGRLVLVAKCGVTLAAALLLAWKIHGKRHGAGAKSRLTDPLLMVCGLLAVLSWWNFGRFYHPRYLHLHDIYHYYIGSKYFPELGYTRLYTCTAAADIEDGAGSDMPTRWIRNLATNNLELASTIAIDPAICDPYFTPARWEMFRRDVAWFRARLSPDLWNVIQLDHGYNASPAWGVLGRLLSSTGACLDLLNRGNRADRPVSLAHDVRGDGVGIRVARDVYCIGVVGRQRSRWI